MALRRTRTENLALSMLARQGVAAIWTLHLAAARAYRDGIRQRPCRLLRLLTLPNASGRAALIPCRSDWPDRPHCGKSSRTSPQPPSRERSDEGRLNVSFVAGMNQFFSMPRKTFEPYGVFCTKALKILWY